MFSFGILVAELLEVACGGGEEVAGAPFGRSETDLAQIVRIVDVLGAPKYAAFAELPSAGLLRFSEPEGGAPGVRNRVRGPEEARDLVGRLVCWDPAERLSAAAVLEHPFVRAHI